MKTRPPSTPQQRPRRYFYGVVLFGGHYSPYAVKAENGRPEGAICCHEMSGTAELAMGMAELLADTEKEKARQRLLGPGLIEDARPTLPGIEHAPDVTPGAVARYVDAETHYSIVLRVVVGEVDALFLSSSERWREKHRSRRATQEEIALGGFALRRATYLVLVRRFLSGFEPTGIVFPPHRVKALQEEFLGKEGV